MANTFVDFISDEHLIKCISNLHQAYQKAKNNVSKDSFYRNKIDVFKMLFDKAFHDLKEEELVKIEIQRQVDRSIVNAIGTFHEEVLCGISSFIKANNGGLDIKSVDNKIFIELKNKHNTVKGENKKEIFNKLENKISKHPNSKAFFARVLDSESTDKIWKFTKNKKEYSNSNIFIISGDQLYKLVTGVDDSLYSLYKALPKAIGHYLESETKSNRNVENSALEEINTNREKTNRTILDQITFENYSYYLGFDKL